MFLINSLKELCLLSLQIYPDLHWLWHQTVLHSLERQSIWPVWLSLTETGDGEMAWQMTVDLTGEMAGEMTGDMSGLKAQTV